MSDGYFGLIFAAVFAILIAAGVAIVWFTLRGRRRAADAATWPTTQATVLSNEVGVRRHRDHDGPGRTYYVPHVRYRYTVHGQTYEGSRISFAGRSIGTRGRAEEVADRYRSGSTIAVRYDPRNPAQATIETDKPSAFKIGFGIVFLALVLTIGHFAYTILQAF